MILPELFEKIILETNNYINEFPSIKKLHIYEIKKPLENLPLTLDELTYCYDLDYNLEKSKIPFGVEVKKAIHP
jgi:hypothetical protein